MWATYARGIGAIAWRQGNKETEFVRRWRDLIAARTDAEEYDDEAAVHAIEGRLDRMTTPLMSPQYPAAAWEAADTPPKPTDRSSTTASRPSTGPGIHPPTAPPTRSEAAARRAPRRRSNRADDDHHPEREAGPAAQEDSVANRPAHRRGRRDDRAGPRPTGRTRRSTLSEPRSSGSMP